MAIHPRSIGGPPNSDWNLVALHVGQGHETVEVNVRKTAGHDLAHINQLERCLAR